MQKNEFERRTGVYLTDLQYHCAEREYERQDENGRDVWPDKDAFCAAYLDNKNGLAERIQHQADEAIWRMEERHRKAMQESAERIEKLKAYCEMLEKKLSGRHPDIITRLELAGMHELMDSVKYDAGSENVGEAAYTICGVIRRFQEGGTQ